MSEIEQTRKTEKRVKKIILGVQKNEVRKYAEITVDYINNMKKLSGEVPEEKLKSNILKFIEKIRFGYNGYVYVNTLDGKSLVYEGKVVNDDLYVKDKLDPDGNNIFRLEYDAAQKPEGGFIKYKFKKIKGSIPESKIAYVKGVPGWGWIVGAGDYVADAQKTSKKVNDSLRKKMTIRLLLIFAVFVIITIVFYYMSNMFSKFAVSQLNILLSHFKNPSGGNDYINKLKIKEMKSLAKEVEKVERDKRLTGEQLREALANMEQKIEERTAELKKQNEELQRYNNLFVNREFRIKELRDEIAKLKKQLENNNGQQ